MRLRWLHGGLAALLLCASVHAACERVAAVAAADRTLVTEGRASGTERVALPDRLPWAGRNERARTRYRIDVSACAASPGAALWLFRVGAPYALRDDAGRPLALLNAGGRLQLARWLPAQGSAPVYNGRLPALFGLPPGTRGIEVELVSLPFLPTGLVHAQVGPTNLLLPRQAVALENVVAFADAASGVVLVLAVLALLLWSQRRGDHALLWLAVACGLWGVRGIAYFGPLVPVNPLLFEQFNPLNVLLASAALTASVLSLLGAFDTRARAWLGGATALSAGALLAALLASGGGSAARALSFATGFVMVAALLVIVWRRRRDIARWHLATLLVSLGGLLCCAVHDLAIVAGALSPERPSFVFWGFVVMLIAFAAMSGQYVVLTLNRAERSNADLERHVEARERLLRDMHDGLGAQLMTALRGLERGALGPQQVGQTLQDSLDELRMLMDSADIGHYLPGALAAWRNRWDHRLAAAGVTLEWRIDESVDAVELPGEAALQVMRIVQEAATNIVKHAQARHMVLEARMEDDGAQAVLCIAVSDDGIGLPAEPARAGARGLKNMARRAQQIGAAFALQPGPGGAGTRVLLRLPAQATRPRRAASTAASARDEMPSLR